MQEFTPQDTPIAIPVLLNSEGDGISIADVGSPTLQSGLVQENDDQELVYTPPAGFSGEDRFSYRIRDRNGTLSEWAVVTIEVSRVNQPPVADNDSDKYAVSDNSQLLDVSLDVLANDRDPDGENRDLRIESVTSGDFTQPRISDDGRTIVYTQAFPFDPYAEEDVAYDSFTYTIQDADGAISQAATVDITVNYTQSHRH